MENASYADEYDMYLECRLLLLMQEDIKRRDLPRAALSDRLSPFIVRNTAVLFMPLLIPSTSTKMPAIEPVSESSGFILKSAQDMELFIQWV